MALDLAAISRAVGGTCVAQRHTDRAQTDGLSRIADYTVVGNYDYTTLVTGNVRELRERLAHGREPAEALTHAVFVSDSDDAELRELCAEHDMTSILGATSGGTELHAQLAALIAEEQAAADRLVAAGTKVLTQAARAGGTPAVLAELVRRIDGWAVLLDMHGHPIGSAGAGQLHIHDAVAVAFGRPVRVRHHGLQVHQVGSDRELAGYLVIASRPRATSRSRDLASQAAALFDLLLRTRDPSVTEHLGRQALLGIVEAGGGSAARLLAHWGVRDESLTAFELGTKTRTIDLERLVTRWLNDLGVEHVFVSEQGRVRGFLPDDLAEDLADRALAFTPMGSGSVHLGIGRPAPIDRLKSSAMQAQQALQVALENRSTVVRYTDLPTVGYVLDGLEGERIHHLAGLLDGLRDVSGQHSELTETLWTFLAEHGAHRASAAKLGIHRQTLVSRVRRVEELTGLSMDRPDDRATAWLALRALESAALAVP
ncbi:MAG: PucR family transcriptional regulator [Leucobacter sp.]